MKWPKGKYNGRKIDGFTVSLNVHLLSWCWMPVADKNHGQPYLIWLFITIRAEPNYN